MKLEELVNDGNCFDGSKLLYQQQSCPMDYMQGVPAYCLCDAKDCKYYSEYKNKDVCNAYIKRKQEVYKK